MKSKPARKNPHLERLFSLRQNIQDFSYTQTHQGHVNTKNFHLGDKKECKARFVPAEGAVYVK